jgi:hypothetical protein
MVREAITLLLLIVTLANAHAEARFALTRIGCPPGILTVH